MTSRVFIVQDLGLVNYSPCAEYGVPHVCVDKAVPLVRLSAAFTTLRKQMTGITKADWIVPTGHPALIGYACYIQATQTGAIRLLVWDRIKKCYLPSEVQI